MASLSAHLREPGDHGRLPFHPDCPVCRRDRLAGTLTDDGIVSRRTQALLAAGALALSSTATTAAFAQEPDREREGTATPGQTIAGDPTSDPDLDPGGISTDLPFDAGPPMDQTAPETGDDAGLPELERATNEDAPVADVADGVSADGVGDQPAPPTTETVRPQPMSPGVPPGAQPTPAPAESVTTPTPATPVADSNIRALAGGEPRRKERRARADKPSPPVPTAPTPDREPVAVPAEPVEAAPVLVTEEPSAASSGTPGGGRAVRPSARFHVVQAGESLWSIANDVLGEDASVAAVAREVNRLWDRNSDRIGTGDPDLLMVGTRLALR